MSENKCCHCAVFKPGVITSQGDISIQSYPGGAAQITISHAPTNKEPTQIHSCTRSQIEPAPCPHNLQDPRVSSLISI